MSWRYLTSQCAKSLHMFISCGRGPDFYLKPCQTSIKSVESVYKTVNS